MELKDSRTYANLMAAFAGESQALVKYVLYAKQARKEGFEQIAGIFDETAYNEQAHAQEWLQYIHGGQLPDTLNALKDAANGEQFEWTEMYREFAEVAHQEGFTQIAAAFEMVGAIEKTHEARYNTFTQELEAGRTFKKVAPQSWVCRNCGYIYEGAEAPAVCPVCKHPQAFFQVDQTATLHGK